MVGQDDTMEGAGSLERGRLSYQKKDYAGALDAFNEAVNSSTSHILLNALDHRAATYEKLDQLQRALRDAKRMIDEMPRLSKGYLRGGKILQLMKKDMVALQIYERGLKKVSIGADKDRALLQSMFNKLKQAQDPGKSRDPLKYLPPELAEMICYNLEIRDRVICLAVTKSWKALLESTHGLWTVLDTSSAKKSISFKCLKIYVRRSNYTVERAIITMKANIDQEKMAFLTRTCKSLREIQILGAGWIGDSLTGALPGAKKLEALTISQNTQITLNALQAALKCCSESLVEMDCNNVKGNSGGFLEGRWPLARSLKSIILSADNNSCMDLHGLRSSTPNVTSVRLNNWKLMPNMVDLVPWAQLKYLHLSNTQLRRFPKLPPTITYLDLSDNPALYVDPNDGIISLPLLETFSCEATLIDAANLSVITRESIENGHLLRLFTGRRINTSNQMPIGSEFPASATVTELSISHLPLDDARTVQILGLYPKVEKLNVSATGITGVAIREFVNSGIKWLILNECHKISPDAVEWARGKGVTVIMNNNPARSGSRRGVSRFADSSFARRFG